MLGGEKAKEVRKLKYLLPTSKSKTQMSWEERREKIERWHNLRFPEAESYVFS